MLPDELSDICDTQFAADRINGLSGVSKMYFRASLGYTRFTCQRKNMKM